MENDLIKRVDVLKLIEDIKMNPEIPKNYATLLDIMRKVREIPATYDMNKVVEQLEQQKNQYFRRSDEIKNRFGENFESHRLFSKACSYDNAIQIVKSSGVS